MGAAQEVARARPRSRRPPARWREAGVLLAALALSVAPRAAAQKRTMAETKAALLHGYSRSTSPSFALAQAAAKNGSCGATPDPNFVEAQIYVERLAQINQVAGTYYIEGFLRMFWNGAPGASV